MRTGKKGLRSLLRSAKKGFDCIQSKELNEALDRFFRYRKGWDVKFLTEENKGLEDIDVIVMGCVEGWEDGRWLKYFVETYLKDITKIPLFVFIGECCESLFPEEARPYGTFALNLMNDFSKKIEILSPPSMEVNSWKNSLRFFYLFTIHG